MALEIVCINLWFLPHLSSCCSTFSPFFHLVWICRCCFLSFFKKFVENTPRIILKAAFEKVRKSELWQKEAE